MGRRRRQDDTVLCLAGVLPAPAETIRVADLDPAKPAERRGPPARLGVVFQNSDEQLFNVTVFDYVAFGPLNLGMSPDQVRQRVAQALARVGLTGGKTGCHFTCRAGKSDERPAGAPECVRKCCFSMSRQFFSTHAAGGSCGFARRFAGAKVVATHDLELIPKPLFARAGVRRRKLVADGPVNAILADSDLLEKHGVK